MDTTASIVHLKKERRYLRDVYQGRGRIDEEFEISCVTFRQVPVIIQPKSMANQPQNRHKNLVALNTNPQAALHAHILSLLLPDNPNHGGLHEIRIFAP